MKYLMSAVVGMLVMVVCINALDGAVFLIPLLFGIVLFIRYSFKGLWWLLGR